MKVKKHNREITFNPNYARKDAVVVIDFPDGEEGYKKFYHENNKLKFCNGCYYEFVEETDKIKYEKFYKKYNNMANYYDDLIVD